MIYDVISPAFGVRLARITHEPGFTCYETTHALHADSIKPLLSSLFDDDFDRLVTVPTDEGLSPRRVRAPKGSDRAFYAAWHVLSGSGLALVPSLLADSDV